MNRHDATGQDDGEVLNQYRRSDKPIDDGVNILSTWSSQSPVPRGIVNHPPDGGAAQEDGEAAHQPVDADQLEAGVTLAL